jgi:hypothetical protein
MTPHKFDQLFKVFTAEKPVPPIKKRGEFPPRLMVYLQAVSYFGQNSEMFVKLAE